MTRTASADSLVDRIRALDSFVTAAAGRLPDGLLEPSRGLVGRAGQRLALSREHTVAALAGATGSGKSSIFNALAGTKLSTVGVRRPTTGVAHACVWGSDGAADLLDWLGVAVRHNQVGGDEALRGLVLLDLPDFDSVESSHRDEVDRVLELVDLIVWVLDPQKYADKVLHRQYLSRFHRHRDITVVVLNQADLLEPDDLRRCLDHLRGLLASDGLAGVPVLATSATSAAPGVEPLTAGLRAAVARRRAVLERLAADVDGVVADLEPLVDADPPRGDVHRDTAHQLTTALADAAGVPVVVRATRLGYRHRALRATGWPLTRWLRRLRPDPLGRLHLGRLAGSAITGPAMVAAPGVGTLPTAGAPTPVTSVPEAAPAAQAAVGLAIRAVADGASRGLPDPWPAAVLAAARTHTGDLTDALDGAVARTDLGLDRRPLWWRGIGLLQWLTTLVALAGLLWLGIRLGMFAIGLPDLVPAPAVGRLPVPTAMVFGGLLAGVLIATLVRPVIGFAARRKGSRAAARLRAEVEKVGEALVLAPVRAVRESYAEARSAVRRAAPRR